MKGGIYVFIFAAQALHELEIAVPHKVALQINWDEEASSESSRPLTEKNASDGARLVLVPETWHGSLGKAENGAQRRSGFHRLGGGTGDAAHAGVDFQA